MRMQIGFFSCVAIKGGSLVAQTVERLETANGILAIERPWFVRQVYVSFMKTRLTGTRVVSTLRFVETCFVNRTLPQRVGGFTSLVVVVVPVAGGSRGLGFHLWAPVSRGAGPRARTANRLPLV